MALARLKQVVFCFKISSAFNNSHAILVVYRKVGS